MDAYSTFQKDAARLHAREATFAPEGLAIASTINGRRGMEYDD